MRHGLLLGADRRKPTASLTVSEHGGRVEAVVDASPAWGEIVFHWAWLALATAFAAISLTGLAMSSDAGAATMTGLSLVLVAFGGVTLNADYGREVVTLADGRAVVQWQTPVRTSVLLDAPADRVMAEVEKRFLGAGRYEVVVSETTGGPVVRLGLRLSAADAHRLAALLSAGA